LTTWRVAVALYSVGLMIQDHRRNCDSHPVLSLEVTNTSDTESNNTCSNGHSSSHHTDTSQAEAGDPANGSQMYHAALMNGKSLDDLLQVFDLPETERAGVLERVLLYGGPHTHFSAEQLQKLEMIKWQRNHEATTNPGGAAHLTWEDTPHITAGPSAESADHPGQPAQKPESMEAAAVKQSQSPNSGFTSKSTPCLPTANTQTPSFQQAVPAEQNASFTALNPCPTFTRRQNQSRRKSSAGKAPFMVPSGATSTTTLASPKRARLQRRNDPRRVQSKPELGRQIVGLS
jgi:hypothetical protein